MNPTITLEAKAMRAGARRNLAGRPPLYVLCTLLAIAISLLALPPQTRTYSHMTRNR